MNLHPGERFTVNSRKYDGSVRRSWQCDLVEQDDHRIDLIGYFEHPVDHPDLGRIEAETVSRERFYLDRWYNYFVFEHPPGILRNYYINICMPPTIGARVIDYVDLDIDVIVWPDGEFETLDMDEFRANANVFGYPEEVIKSAMAALQEIEKLMKTHPTFPLNLESCLRSS